MMLPWKTVGMHVPTDSPALFQMLFASKAWKVTKEQYIQSRSRYIQVYSTYLYIVVCTFLTISYPMISCANLYFQNL